MNLSAINSATKGKVRTTGVSSFLELELSKVYPNPNQPRKDFIKKSIKQTNLKKYAEPMI